MAKTRKNRKPLSVEPIKVGQPVGATLAFLGLDRCIPLLHGSQGCTAFGKFYLTRHFREPIPLQTTAVDQVSAVMGADGNAVEALATLGSKSSPEVIGFISTGLMETEGCDLTRIVQRFRHEHPGLADMAVAPVNAPDFGGGLESGFALAVKAMVEHLLPEGGDPGSCPTVNVLAGSSLTPGDIEALEEMILSFGLTPLILPNLARSLDGSLPESDYSPLTRGGSTRRERDRMGHARATLVIGASLIPAGERMAARTGVPSHYFPSLVGLEATDRLLLLLAALSERRVPELWRRRRKQMLDALMDSHFVLTHARVGVAGDPDFLLGWHQLLAEVGAEPVAVVASHAGPGLSRLSGEEVLVGDLEDMADLCADRRPDLLIGSTHLALMGERLHLPTLRAGYPVFDRLGGFRRTWIGYGGGRDALFDLANLILAKDGERVAPYRSTLSSRDDGGDTLVPEGLRHVA